MKMYPHIQNQTYREILTWEYKKKKEEDALVGNPEGVSVIPKTFGKTADNLLSDIVKANRNKIIIIDFWATWCGPCLDDFSTMRPIKEIITNYTISKALL